MGVDDASAGHRPDGHVGPGLTPAPLTGSLFLGDIAKAAQASRSASRPSPGRGGRPGDRLRRRDGEERLWLRRAMVTLLVLALMAVSIVVSRTGPRHVLRALGWGGPPCPAFTHVDVVASPDISATLDEVLKPVQKSPLGDGDTCLTVSVIAQDPAQTLAGTAVLPHDRWPHLWVPDSSLWLARAAALRTERIGALATSPMVLATSSGRATTLGWTVKPPTWSQALGETDAVTLPDPTADTKSLLAVVALRSAAGSTADEKVAHLAIAAQRSGATTAEDAFALARTGSATAPVLVTTEQAVFAQTRGSAASGIVAVSPVGGVPVLDYPLAEIAPPDRTVPERQGMRLVERTLLSSATSTSLRHSGFRDPQGRADGSSPVQSLPVPSEDQLAQVRARLSSLTVPTHLLAVVDISASMRDATGGRTRIHVVRDALRTAVSAWRDSDQVGLWIFASELDRWSDHREVARLAPLGDDESGVSHRRRLLGQANALPALLRPGGTSLYDTTLQAVQAVSAHYDRLASNVVVLLTDGRNEDVKGLQLPQLLQQLQAVSRGPRPVRVVAVGIGAGADMGALNAIAGATPGGRALRASDPSTLQRILFQALTAR